MERDKVLAFPDTCLWLLSSIRKTIISYLAGGMLLKFLTCVLFCTSTLKGTPNCLMRVNFKGKIKNKNVK